MRESSCNRNRTLLADNVFSKAVRQKKRKSTDEDHSQGQRKQSGMVDFPLTHFSPSSVLLCLRASPIATAPLSAMKLLSRLCDKRKGKDEDNAQGQRKERVDSQE